MLATLCLGASLLMATPSGATVPAPSPADLAAYEAARARVGRDAEAHVQLALWCEAHGLTAERLKHLALAVLTDKGNAAARGLMGLVDDHGRWQRPEAVSDRVKADEALSAKLAEYNARRARTDDTADGQWKLALWCEEAGLKPEARAHLASVTRLDPAREAAWKRLGFKKLGKRWVTDEQVKAEKAEADAQRQADQRWRPLLTRWRAWLHEKGKWDEAEAGLAGVTDPRAVPSVWAVFGEGDAPRQEFAVRVLGQIDAPGSSRALATLAVFGKSPEVARAASETLRRRDPRDVVDLLIGLVRDPVKYEVRPVNGPNAPGVLFVEGRKYNVRRLYGPTAQQLPQVPSRLFDPSVPFDPYNPQNLAMASQPDFLPQPGSGPGQGAGRAIPNLTAMAAQRDVIIGQAVQRIGQITALSQQQLANDVAAVEAMNADAGRANGLILPVLHAVTGEDRGADSEAWRSWWTDQQGYAYRSPEPQDKPTLTTFVENPAPAVVPPHNACFGAGTPVRTLEGPRPIESVRVGDQVLSQNTRTGRLSFTPVVAVFHNPPAPTLRVTLGDESTVATGIHRFWKAGQGWVMARDLKPGDAVRTVGGTARVDAVETETVRPVFNLEVADGQTFFVGRAGALVHDNSLVRPEPAPFDAVTEFAAGRSPAESK